MIAMKSLQEIEMEVQREMREADMKLLDMYATAYLQGLSTRGIYVDSAERIAEDAFKVAEAMLAKRKELYGKA